MGVAIILSSYNGEKYLGEQIDSIIAQDYCDWKLFVFDDCSSDKTEEVVRSRQERACGRIEFCRNSQNFGSTKSFLNGLFSVYDRFPATEYFMFCDQDDCWNTDKISVSINAIRTRGLSSGPVLAFTDCVVTDSGLNEIAPSFIRQSGYNVKRIDLAGLLMENKCIGCTCVLNRELAGLLREHTDPEMKEVRFHDWWSALAAAAFGSVVFVPEATMRYRQHEKNVVGVSDRVKYIKDRSSDSIKRHKALEETFLQGRAFYSSFGRVLSGRSREIVEGFIKAADAKGLKRRLICLHYGFLKSGLFRNIGLMLSL